MQFYTKNEPPEESELPAKNSINEILRYARYQDIQQIENLLAPFVKRGILLSKDKRKIEADLPGTVVYIDNDQIVGVANLFQYEEILYELRGMAIHENYQNKGIGKKIIEKLLSDLGHDLGDKMVIVFALTGATDFFLKLGWEVVKKEKFPRKIFDDCMFCSKKEECFEDAVEITLNGKK